MKRMLLGIVAAAMLGGLPAAASASVHGRGGLFFGLNVGPVGVGPFGFGFRNFGYRHFGFSYAYVAPPVCYVPAPVYSPPVIYSAAPICSPPVVYSAAPVYVAPPVYYSGQTYYYYGGPYHREYHQYNYYRYGR